ncbi:CRISPR-associated protein Cmr6 [Seinonella peptonophila]|uniref:CRISPR-associated protein Cmr6 n=1 Tax=Seinonella peptonophila TaxID=112248 RepID=A0A1M5A2P2_9BACL|nr:type III-B CRISPR module RAMP protein Cmr6 [Seinonella peptonophila]SHF24102.1 CRISPR-associated protein Cmr6 [Seinonella peptonophila]
MSENNLFGKIPLYADPAIFNKYIRSSNANAGLWFDKFCHTWEADPNHKWKRKNNKQNWIETITHQHDGKTGDEALIQETVERHLDLVENLNGQVIYTKTTSRFITGMGNSNPIENGFTWHHTLGTPYLPGTSVKGLIRDWAQQWTDTSHDVIQRLFGPEPTSNQLSVGSLIFFDALPLEPIKCEVDIITPHYTQYYQNPTTQHPNGWENPVPIPFLTVAEHQPFLFSIAPRKQQNNNEVCITEVLNWLKDALEYGGVGAKTSVGYGRFAVMNVDK